MAASPPGFESDDEIESVQQRPCGPLESKSDQKNDHIASESGSVRNMWCDLFFARFEAACSSTLAQLPPRQHSFTVESGLDTELTHQPFRYSPVIGRLTTGRGR